MPSRDNAASRADVLRQRMELGLRAVGFVALIVALLVVQDVFRSGAADAGAPVLSRVAYGDSATLGATVRQSLLSVNGPDGAKGAALQPIHLVASSVPGDAVRAQATAARIAGIPLSWTDSTSGNGAIAVEVQPVIDPRGGYTLRVAAPSNAEVSLRDSVGLIDTIRTKFGGGSINTGSVAGSVRAATTNAEAVVAAPPPATLRRILLYASPGWEAKFTQAALEERGWTVEARYAIGKNVTVTQGAPSNPDTARYAAVIALDSSALAYVAAIRRYADGGGGVVLGGTAVTLREFGELLPGRAGTRLPGVPGALATPTPLVGLAWRPIAPDSNAIVLEQSARKVSGSNATVVARRFGSGRVVAMGYDGVWEWRMAGPDGSLDAHRQWWSSIVGAVAYAPEAAGAVGQAHSFDVPGSSSPYADTRARLGASVAMPAMFARPSAGTPWELLLVALAVMSLVGEWASRRLRGVR